jgi:sporulation integral membrane protein YtvI
MGSKIKRNLIITVLFILGIVLIRYFFIYFSPFIIATVMAFLINPIVDKFDEWIPLNRGFSVFLVLVLLISLLLIFIILGGSQIYLESNRLLRNLPDYNTFEDSFQWFMDQNNQLKLFIDNLDLSPSIKNAIDSNLQVLYNALKNGLIKIINSVLGLFGKLPHIFTILFLSFIATYFISRDKDLINDFIIKLFPGEIRSKIFRVEKELVSSAVGFIRAELILISITGIISGIGLLILGNQYALIIGISSALLDLIPIIGPALIFIPWIIYNLVVVNFSYSFKLLIIYTLMAGVRQGAEGKIMGSSLGLHPLTTMIALYVGFRTMGAIGFIIGPAILVIFKSIYRADIIHIKE